MAFYYFFFSCCVCLKMQGGMGNRDPLFGNGGPFGGFGGQRSLLPGFFGGRDPFDDPFFTRPFGGLFESSFFGSNGNPFANMHPSPFHNMHPSPFDNMHPSGYIEQQVPEQKKSRGPIIEELDSDNEKTEGDEEKKVNPRKHGRRSKEPYVEDPDDEAEVRKSKQLQSRSDYSRFNGMGSQPQGLSFTFQSSSVIRGGANGAYYTSSSTRRAGSDGVTFEENKEANSVTGQATHKVSRGLHNKGHSFTRKLKSDGRVDTMQTLHNLNEDELSGFEEAWKGHAGKNFPGWTGSFTGIDNMGTSSSGKNAQARRGGWALPSAEGSQPSERMVPDTTVGAGSSRGQQSGRRKASSGVKDTNGYPRWKPKK
ncbi:MYELOID LEUKEMIA FACTOR [Salix koriyanagi]|uniref:MYELOID LEUKEMIA FACTOR n=1 Tax=Salix koriyanagi TaxID=2511006 RepID=A0A9Q0SZW6_9ROSI|nr:MYELOID LEUKEMIA FACTOR [Salix koriyanagi]